MLAVGRKLIAAVPFEHDGSMRYSNAYSSIASGAVTKSR